MHFVQVVHMYLYLHVLCNAYIPIHLYTYTPIHLYSLHSLHSLYTYVGLYTTGAMVVLMRWLPLHGATDFLLG